MQTNNILYIGRFQPFHNGHADAIKQIKTNAPKNTVLYIGIGSAEENFTPHNPLTAGERFQMIQESVSQIDLPFPFFIVPIRNINHYALWPNHVQQYLPPIHQFYSGSPLVSQLWKKSFPHTKIIHLTKNIPICASDIRSNSNQLIEKSCHSAVSNLWKQWDINQRISKMRTC